MKTKFLQKITELSLCSIGSRIVVACSGGADSMCLLHLFLECRSELGIILEVAHVNHGIRGSEADRDEEFVREFCKYNDVVFHCLNVCIPEIAKQTSESIELCARRIRYEFFDSLNADYIATAHTGSDRIETMLMNLSRGASLSGLCSIPPSRGNIIRPLIDFTRDEIERYCELHSLTYVTDSTNLTDEYTRNKFRHNVIEQLKIINPSFESNALNCINMLNEENEYLSYVTEKAYNACLNADGSLNVKLLRSHPLVIRRRIIKMFFDFYNICSYESRHIEFIVQNLESKFSLMLPSAKKICCRENRLFFEIQRINSIVEKTSVNISENTVISLLNKRIVINHTKILPENYDGYFVADFSKISDTVCVRSRESGDVFHLGRRKCSKTLKKLFNELKIPLENRDSLIVLSDENGLIYVEGIGVDSLRYIDSHTSEYLLIKVEEIIDE